MSSDKPRLHGMLFQNQNQKPKAKKKPKPKTSPWQVLKELTGFAKLWFLVIAWEIGLPEPCLNGIPNSSEWQTTAS